MREAQECCHQLDAVPNFLVPLRLSLRCGYTYIRKLINTLDDLSKKIDQALDQLEAFATTSLPIYIEGQLTYHVDESFRTEAYAVDDPPKPWPARARRDKGEGKDAGRDERRALLVKTGLLRADIQAGHTQEGTAFLRTEVPYAQQRVGPGAHSSLC